MRGGTTDNALPQTSHLACLGHPTREFASELAFNKVVTVQVRGTDQYGRLVGEVPLPEEKRLKQELVRAGLEMAQGQICIRYRTE